LIKTNKKYGFIMTVLILIIGILFTTIGAIKLSHPISPYVDDAYIFLRFAENINDYGAIVWNPGETPVEGYTSFLYLMILTAFNALGFDISLVSGWIGIIFSLLTLLIAWKISNLILPSRSLIGVVTVALIAFSPSFIYWSTSGMDVPFISFLTVLSSFLYLVYLSSNISPYLLGLSFTLFALARPEGIGYIAFILALECIRSLYLYKKINWSVIFKIIVPFLVVYLPYFIWRWQYFGYPLPNTYYAKTGAGLQQIVEGVKYWWSSLIGSFGINLVLFTVFLSFIKIKYQNKINFTIAFLTLFILTSWGMTMLNGGDHFGHGRFLLPVMPLFLLLVAYGYANLAEKNKRVFWLGIISVMLIAGVWSSDKQYSLIRNKAGDLYYGRQQTLPTANPEKFEVYDQYVPAFKIMGQKLSQIDSDATIAVIPIGAIGYYSKTTVVDMLGIVNPVIAHQPFDPIYTSTWRPGHDKGDGNYVLSLSPKYIQLYDFLTSQPLSEPDDHMLQYKSVVEIWNNPEFHEKYEYYPVEAGNGWYYNLYRRKN
jgi:arabinofuranosyltransferase